jgi:hypothetical protein
MWCLAMKSAFNWLCNLVFLCVLFVALSGCSAVELAAGYVVDEYCDKPQVARFAVRSLVNAGSAPHSVHIHCATDPDFYAGQQ